MLTIGLIRERKVPADNRVALIPSQCRWIHRNRADIKIIVESSPDRCFSDQEYNAAGIEVKTDMNECDILLGIKEVTPDVLLANKTYCFFSHTRKKQPYNRVMLQTIVKRNITLIDYECLEHEDGQRIIGFGFFAGIVGAHNGMMAFGSRTRSFTLDRVHKQKDFRELIHGYFGLKLPNVKIAVTGSGRVASGVLEIMNLMGVIEVEPDEFLARNFKYPVYVHLKGAELYQSQLTGRYNREDFHLHPSQYESRFEPYLWQTDVLLNGVYWAPEIPRLFDNQQMADPRFRIQTIADITDDVHGSVPCNLGDATIAEPVYGVHRTSIVKIPAYSPEGVDVMAVGNLPNELPRDASRYFGEQLIKYILDDLTHLESDVIRRATIVTEGDLTAQFEYLRDYLNG